MQIYYNKDTSPRGNTGPETVTANEIFLCSLDQPSKLPSLFFSRRTNDNKKVQLAKIGACALFEFLFLVVFFILQEPYMKSKVHSLSRNPLSVNVLGVYDTTTV
jgi:hypothetical protein